MLHHTILRSLRQSTAVIGILSILWFLLRTGTRPTRASYPCQQTSALVGYAWLSSIALPLFSSVRTRAGLHMQVLAAAGVLIFLAAVILTGLYAIDGSKSEAIGKAQVSGLTISERTSSDPDASDIFAVNGTNGADGGMDSLIDLMDKKGLPFYILSGSENGIIANDDVVLIKVNSQWDERGGTNTDLVAAIIRAILSHPDGFTGEIVIADNGQGQYGSTGSGGSLNYSHNNALDKSQSMEAVADSFPNDNVSTYLWDTITTRQVREYDQGDDMDGYIVSETPDIQTGIIVSYPKFKTRYGTRISFKMGVWDQESGSYNSSRLKVINVPVLKTHGGYGVTASVKHYMGVVSDKLTASFGNRENRAHFAIASGGMGTEMVQTRFPALNILDAIWINAHPRGGPETSYDEATWTGVIAASTDPVALDCWSARRILMPISLSLGYADLSSMDPDSQSQPFAKYMRLSIQELRRAEYPVTMNESMMRIHVAQVL